MRRLRVEIDFPDPVVTAEAVGVIAGGGILALPTDTLYGLSCHPGKEAAIRRLRHLKGRSPDHRIPFIAADRNQAARIVLFSEEADLLAGRFWPGPLSLILPASGSSLLAPALSAPNFAVRVPASPLARAVAAGAGSPLPATSLNVTGTPAIQDPDLIPAPLAEGIDLLLDGGPLPGSLASTLLDLTGAFPRILRRGPVSPEAIAEVLGQPVALHPGEDPSLTRERT